MFQRMQRIGQSPGSWRAKHDRVPINLARSLYAEVRQLSEKDPSPVSVARRLSASHGLSLSPGTVRHWMVGDRKVQRRNVFKADPSPELSYIIGANIGDGCTLTKNWIVKLEVTDHDFAERFNDSMAKFFNRTSSNRILVRLMEGRLPLFVVKYSNMQLVKLLRLPMNKLLKTAFVHPRQFLQGFFDAEGHVDISVTQNFKVRVGVENSDKYLLAKVRKSLRDLNMSSRLERKREAGSVKVIRNSSFVMKRTSFSVVISRLEGVRRFSEEIGFSIHRKVQKLADALSVIENHEARDWAARWKGLYSKVRGEWVRLPRRLGHQRV